MTYEEKLPSSMPNGNLDITYGHGGSCGIFDKCNDHLTIYKPNNKKYRQQGAVSSSIRLDRLKLNTISWSQKDVFHGAANNHQDVKGYIQIH